MDKHFVSKTNTPADIKDLWRTPRDFFSKVNDEFNFTTDVFASSYNALCPVYFDVSDDAFTLDWIGSCWCNPPYSKTNSAIYYAPIQARKNNSTIVMLVNANTDTKWFKDAFETANEIRLISGRLSFIRDDGKKANGNTKGQCLIIWRGKCETPCQITLIDR